ncbi:MAG TPA: YfhO family protein, partial [Flavisolibacter sp.]
KAIQAISTLPEQMRNQIPLSYYWGGLISPSSVGTSGPPYVGAIICFLAIIGFFILDNRHKWWILSICILAILMSWGKYFSGFNTILYHYLPLYNKFRAPSMILVIPQLLLPLMAVLTVNKVVGEKEKLDFLPYFKKGLLGVGATILLLFVCYLTFDFRSSTEKEILTQVASSGQAQVTDAIRNVFEGLSADRKSLMMGDIWRTIGFCLLALGLLYLAIRKIMNPLVLGVAFSLLVLADLIPIDNKYLNHENYQEPTDNDLAFQINEMDKKILEDTSYFRVFNLQSPFQENLTAYHFNAVGGYHPAKLRIYQELIEKQISQEQNVLVSILQNNPAGLDSAHLPALNMLNTKYFIAKHPHNGQTSFQQVNNGALGPVWLVRSLQTVPDAKAEMAALASLNPRDTAVMQQAFRNQLKGATNWTAQGQISLDNNGNQNDIINYTFNSNEEQFAVFSEVYYDAGWRAFIDGKEAPILKVNYVLRGLQIPAGAHKIVFKFEPQDYFLGRKLTTIFTIALLL